MIANRNVVIIDVILRAFPDFLRENSSMLIPIVSLVLGSMLSLLDIDENLLKTLKNYDYKKPTPKVLSYRLESRDKKDGSRRDIEITLMQLPGRRAFIANYKIAKKRVAVIENPDFIFKIEKSEVEMKWKLRGYYRKIGSNRKTLRHSLGLKEKLDIEFKNATDSGKAFGINDESIFDLVNDGSIKLDSLQYEKESKKATIKVRFAESNRMEKAFAVFDTSKGFGLIRGEYWCKHEGRSPQIHNIREYKDWKKFGKMWYPRKQSVENSFVRMELTLIHLCNDKDIDEKEFELAKFGLKQPTEK